MICSPDDGQWKCIVGEQFKRLLAAIERNLRAREAKR